MEYFYKRLFVVIFSQLLAVTSALKQYPITEEGTENEYIANIQQDFDFSPLSPSDPPRLYQILIGQDKVAIHPNGDIHTKGKLDREKICPLDPPKCLINVEIGVKDTEFKQIKIQLVLEDLNDNTPRFPTDRIEKEISESASIGTIIRLDSALDPDLNLNSIQRYEISDLIVRGLEESVNVLPSEFPFDLNVFRNIDGTMIPELNLTKRLDREKASSYELLLAAVDGGTPEQSGTATVLVSVVDANDNKPKFSQSTFVVSVPESVQPGYTVIQLEATDKDHGSNADIEYSFSSLVSAQDRAIFNIDRYTGIISISSNLDYENKTIHHLTVEAKDSRTNPNIAYATVTVQVLDVNDAAPRISVNYFNAVERPDLDDGPLNGQPKPVLILENLPIGEVIAFVTVTDDDTGISGNVSCTLKDSSSFVMEAKGENRYLIKTNQELDREFKRFHNIEIDAWDFGSPSLSSIKTIVVELADENDNDPKFAKSTYHLTVKENIKPGEDIATLNAEDSDSGVNAEITYSAYPVPRNAHVPFAIKPNTGDVYFKEGATPLDAENETKPFRLIVTATDNGIPRRNTSTNLVITVADVNDNPPRFKLKSYVFRIREDAKAGLYIGKVTADDDDIDKSTNGKISYKFEPDIAAFSIKAETGQIYFVGNSNDLDREVRLSQPYVFTVIATDHGDTPMMDSCTVDIYIVDINDNSPVISTPNVTSDIFVLYISARGRTISERHRRNVERQRGLLTSSARSGNSSKPFPLSKYLRIGSTATKTIRTPESFPVMITQVEAEDMDEGENGRVRFSIEEGNLYNYFSIDPQSGKIFLNIKKERSLRKMHRGCHVIKISAKDLGKPSQHSNGWANIFITDRSPEALNKTKAMKNCTGNPFFPVEYLSPSDDVALSFLNLYMIIIIVSVAVVLLLLICIIGVVARRRCECCRKKSRSYKCKDGSVSYPDGGYQEGMTYQAGNHKGSMHQADGEEGDNRSSYCVDWTAAQLHHAQEKEGMLMRERNVSSESVRSHNSGKDSGTGDSMPSDAYHAAAAGGKYRPQYPNQAYRQIYWNQMQPSHVSIPQDDLATTTDEERRSYVSNQGRLGPKCTNECRVNGCGDRCWMPDSLQRPTTRMTSFKNGEDFDGGSLKKRSMTPNSYQRQQIDNMRYVPYYNGPVQAGVNANRGDFTSFSGEMDPDTQQEGRYHPYSSHITQPPYTQSPIPFNSVSATPYLASQQNRGKHYVNVQGATYEAIGIRAEQGRNYVPSTSSGGQYQNFSLSQSSAPQQFYPSDEAYHLRYAPTYQAYEGVAGQGYHDEQGQYYGVERAADNEFAATSLILSPADSEPGDYKRRLEQQLTQQQRDTQQQANHPYTRSINPESQQLLDNENVGSNPAEDDASVAKLSTIREELNADEVLAAIDGLL